MVLLAAAATGCSSASTPSQQIETRYGHLSYAATHESIADAAKDSDLIAVATVVDSRTEADKEVPTLPITIYRLRIDQKITGPSVISAQLMMRGGVLNGVDYVVEGEDPIVIGERDVLFLKRITVGPYAGAYVLGGPDCRVTVKSDGHLVTRGSLRLGSAVTDVESLTQAISN